MGDIFQFESNLSMTGTFGYEVTREIEKCFLKWRRNNNGNK